MFRKLLFIEKKVRLWGKSYLFLVQDPFFHWIYILRKKYPLVLQIPFEKVFRHPKPHSKTTCRRDWSIWDPLQKCDVHGFHRFWRFSRLLSCLTKELHYGRCPYQKRKAKFFTQDNSTINLCFLYVYVMLLRLDYINIRYEIWNNVNKCNKWIYIYVWWHMYHTRSREG